jgi:hypothetical protein
MGLSFIPLYRFMGPLAMPILFLMFIWGTVRLVVTIIIQSFTMHLPFEGSRLWMLGAF